MAISLFIGVLKLPGAGFCRVADNIDELFGFQAGAADESAVYIDLTDEFGDVCGINATAVKDARLSGCFLI